MIVPVAGDWASGWRDPATETVRRTFTIITTTPNEALADLHDRMPVVLSDDAWARWLDPRGVGSKDGWGGISAGVRVLALSRYENQYPARPLPWQTSPVPASKSSISAPHGSPPPVPAAPAALPPTPP